AVGLLFCASGLIQAETVDYAYDHAGRLIGVDYGNGRKIDYTYDDSGNLTRSQLSAIVDTDNDGMDDTWERKYFGTLARDGTGDFDNDGQSDRAEFLA